MKPQEARQGAPFIEFGEFRLIPGERLLMRGDIPVHLTPKVFDVLVLLVEAEGRLIEKEQMIDRLWPETFVEEATLARTVSTLRKALGESSEVRYIETVPKRGYRFIAEVRHSDQDELRESAVETIQTETDSASRRWFVSRPVLALSLVAIVLVSAGVIVSWNRPLPQAAEMKSIAVLPFSRIGEGERDETLEFGMADTLITHLSKLRRVIVRPTSAVSKYAVQNSNALQAGRDLQVDAVLEGSVQKSGARVRVNVHLISTADGSTLWADNFDTAFTNIFAVQDTISERVVSALSPRLTGDRRLATTRRSTENPEAYRLYLQGRFFWNKRTVQSLRQSTEYFEQAIAIDPQYALAYAGLADCHQMLAEYLAATPADAYAKARAAAEKALSIDDELAEAHTSLAYTLAFYDWNWIEAEREFKRALELDPNYATAHHWYSEFLMTVGRFDESLAENEKAARLDPTSLIIQTNFAAFYFITRDFDESLRRAQKVIDADPDFAYPYIFICFSSEAKGLRKESIEAYIRSVELFGERAAAEELRAVLSKNGIEAAWKKRIDQVDPARQPSFSALWRAILFTFAGDKQKSLDWLEQAYDHRDRWIVNIKHSAGFDALRNDPRFLDLVRRIGL
ncbi:MAG: winged helix-turn-helix domain-containing protein [Pyrinomonadaceae bacterium]